MISIDDIIVARGWNAEQALHMVAVLEDFIHAIWSVHGPDMANQLQFEFAKHEEDH